MTEYDQTAVDVAAAEENALLQQAQLSHLQQRVVLLNLRVRELEAELAPQPGDSTE